MSLQKLFSSEVQEALAYAPPSSLPEQFTATTCSALPAVIRKYLEACGYYGKPCYRNIFIHYEHTGIKLTPAKNWQRLACQQFNTLHPPTRLALMQTRLYGILSFAARDKYQQGHGNMLIKLAGFTLSNATGKEMNQASLVTYLAETPLLPAAFLQNRIVWQKAGANRVRASITDADITVSGEFFVDDRGLINEFRTNDRFYSRDGKAYMSWGWSALYDRYRELNGIKVPTVVRAVWHMPQGQEYAYFRAGIKDITYNLSG